MFDDSGDDLPRTDAYDDYRLGRGRGLLHVFRGKLELSSQRGLVQTFVETQRPGADGGGPTLQSIGNTSTRQMATGVDPNPSGTGPSNGPVDHVFPVARGGWQLYLLVTGTFATAARLAVGYDIGE